MSDPLPLPVTPPVTVRKLATEILSRREFRRDPPTLMSRLIRWILDLLADVVRSATGANFGLLGWVVIAVLVSLVVFALYRSVLAFQRNPDMAGGVADDGVRRAPQDWRAEAAAHEAAGRWRDALRCHWRALVAELAERGLVQEIPGRTTGEYRRAVARSVPEVVASFSEATVLFEVAWYAAGEVGPADTARCKELSADVLAGAMG